jgi:hypothetical protein
MLTTWYLLAAVVAVESMVIKKEQAAVARVVYAAV